MSAIFCAIAALLLITLVSGLPDTKDTLAIPDSCGTLPGTKVVNMMKNKKVHERSSIVIKEQNIAPKLC